MDITAVTDAIALGVIAAATLGAVVLAFTAGIKNWKRLRAAS
jgi:coat protein B